MRWRRVLAALAVGGVLVAACELRFAHVRYPERVATPSRPDPDVWRGVWHVHSVLSDGIGTVEEIAHAAKRAGAGWVVMADHNVVDPQGTRYIGGVLVIAASEVSTPEGHLVALGIPRALTESERTGDAVGSIRALGGVPVAAHPINRKRPYTRLDDPRLGGLEILSWDDRLREAIADPLTLLPALLAYPVNPQYAMVSALRRPEGSLAAWDRLLATRPIPAFCAIDAHGRPPYEDAMRTLAMYARAGPRTGDARQDSQRLIGALAEGRSYCAIDAFADGSGFTLESRVGEKAVVGRLDYQEALPAELSTVCPGACRVEARFRTRRGDWNTWIIANSGFAPKR